MNKYSDEHIASTFGQGSDLAQRIEHSGFLAGGRSATRRYHAPASYLEPLSQLARLRVEPFDKAHHEGSPESPLSISMRASVDGEDNRKPSMFLGQF